MDRIIKIKDDSGKIYKIPVSYLIAMIYSKSKKPLVNYYNIFRRILRSVYVNCENCGKYKSTIVHHKDSNRNNNQINNFTLLCQPCHLRLHHPKKEGKYFTYIHYL